jgi:hypothetical protein
VVTPPVGSPTGPLVPGALEKSIVDWQSVMDPSRFRSEACKRRIAMKSTLSRALKA